LTFGTAAAARLVPKKLFTIEESYSQSLDRWRFVWYIITMKENIYKVTLIDGPTTAIMPIKARDFQHATRIASRMGLGVVCAVEFACEKSDS
jgi:hypothetical protein